ncbi:CAP domain-containing protein [Sphingomonas glaciei]|uniref:CAP domain-containing protein n=1 Tax=Sphingomonas glaciei TaxID=2938948 RepID=A0ABY5MW94_9SPHN|nr:CAP domain-containing protein [Sphingomonas glaciei]UUR08392.1 CAP domain-containing protein [Sphingomonas glaciei]
MSCRIPLLLALALLPATVPAAAQSWEAQALALHNRERAAFRVAPLAWDFGLAGAADAYANEMVRTGRWGHSPKATRPGQGENLWMGTVNAYRIDEMVGGWIGERRLFRPGVFPEVSATGNWIDVGHYTQMVSSRSTRVGCAIRSGGRWTYLVCRYSPSGNVDGRVMP